MDVYAIRHIPTGYFIPDPKGRGGTHLEPRPGPPRLFTKEGSAKGFLTVWLRGKITVGQTMDYDGGVDEDWRVIPVASRRREEMEIITYTLVPKEELK